MSGKVSIDQHRGLPQFIDNWRAGFVETAHELDSLDYLDVQQGLPFAIAAQWLFCPDFVEYRGCVVAIHHNDGKLNDHEKATIDGWFNHFNGDIPSIEGKANLLIIPDLFSNTEQEPYEQDLPDLARSIARCWRGLLAVQFPHRHFTIEVYADPEEAYDPQITFYTKSPNATNNLHE